MRLRLLLTVALALPLTAQQPAAPQPSALAAALSGHWTGVLEYRDYSEPAASLKRVQLPTWLTIAPHASDLGLSYTYDDGPTKTVTENDTLTLDEAAATFRIVSGSGEASTFTITGLEKLRSGRGELVLSGTGKDNGKPADLRTTLTIRRNLLAWLEEARPAGSTEPFAFRHRYTFTRAEPPRSTPPAKTAPAR